MAPAEPEVKKETVETNPNPPTSQEAPPAIEQKEPEKTIIPEDDLPFDDDDPTIDSNGNPL